MSTKQAEISAHIDWISVTVPFQRAMDLEHRVVLVDDFQAGFISQRGSMGYVNARRYNSGAVAQWHESNRSMGYHVTYSAQALRYAAENFNLSQDEILEVLSSVGRVSRIDLAIDLSNVKVDIRQLHQDAVHGVLKTRAKTFDYVESAKKGQELGASTTYIGSMSKRKKLLRIYDKGMQLNLDEYKTRFELELHGQLAQTASMQLRSDIENMGKTIKSLINGYADFSNTHVAEHIASDAPIKITHPVYQKSDTAAWLIDVVAKTLAKETYLDYNVFEHFSKAFEAHYNKLVQSEDINESGV